MNQKRHDLLMFAALVSRECPALRPYEVATFCDDIIKIGKTIQSLATSACNYQLSKWQETRWDNLISKADDLCAGYGLKAIHTSDPRGVCLKIGFPSGDTNGFGRYGWLVPIE